jgi:UDP-3-O-[3-hydroxymyristoyl] glucosamine N-acyltransferase
MSARSFFRGDRQISVGEIAKLTGAELRRNADPAKVVTGIATLDRAGPSDLACLDQARWSDRARASTAGACLTDRKLAGYVPARVALLVVENPFQAFVDAARALFPEALRPSSLFSGADGVPCVAAVAVMHPSARMEIVVSIDHG